jgi:inosine/xanthosine triphosphatase
MKIIVGSQNPVKINAVKRAFGKYFEDVIIKGVEVNSGVSSQPMTPEESYQGAYNRARKVLDSYDCDYGIGIEGGLETFSFGTTTCGFVVILGKNGEEGIGTSARMLLPDRYVDELQKRKKELGDLVSEDAGEDNFKQKGGMFGLFTQGVVSREDAYFQGVVFALSKIINTNYYY